MENIRRADTIIKLRYHIESGRYYIQIQGEQYKRLNTKIKRVTTCINHLQKDRYKEQRIQMEQHRKCLVRERQKAQRYVEVAEEDIPENAKARPMYKMPGEIVTADPEWYAQLVEKLRQKVVAAALAQEAEERAKEAEEMEENAEEV